jgi:hypothetical protein
MKINVQYDLMKKPFILTDLTEGEDGAAAKCLHEEHGGDVGGHLGGGHGRQAPEEVLEMTKRVLCEL